MSTLRCRLPWEGFRVDAKLVIHKAGIEPTISHFEHVTSVDKVDVTLI